MNAEQKGKGMKLKGSAVKYDSQKFKHYWIMSVHLGLICLEFIVSSLVAGAFHSNLYYWKKDDWQWEKGEFGGRRGNSANINGQMGTIILFLSFASLFFNCFVSELFYSDVQNDGMIKFIGWHAIIDRHKNLNWNKQVFLPAFNFFPFWDAMNA